MPSLQTHGSWGLKFAYTHMPVLGLITESYRYCFSTRQVDKTQVKESIVYSGRLVILLHQHSCVDRTPGLSGVRFRHTALPLSCYDFFFPPKTDSTSLLLCLLCGVPSGGCCSIHLGSVDVEMEMQVGMENRSFLSRGGVTKVGDGGVPCGSSRLPAGVARCG